MMQVQVKTHYEDFLEEVAQRLAGRSGVDCARKQELAYDDTLRGGLSRHPCQQA